MGISRIRSSLSSCRCSSVLKRSSTLGGFNAILDFALVGDHLPGQFCIRLGNLVIRVKCIDAFANCARFRSGNGGGNLRIKHPNPAAVALADHGAHILGKIGAVVHHGQKNTADPQALVDALLDALHRLQQLVHALGGQIVRLHGDDNAVRSGQGIQRNETQGGRTVDENIVIVTAIFKLSSFLILRKKSELIP